MKKKVHRAKYNIIKQYQQQIEYHLTRVFLKQQITTTSSSLRKKIIEKEYCRDFKMPHTHIKLLSVACVVKV